MPVKVFVAFGGKEGDDPVISEQDGRADPPWRSNFRAAGYDDSNFRFVLEPEACTPRSAWAQRLPGALTFLFGDWKELPAPAH